MATDDLAVEATTSPATDTPAPADQQTYSRDDIKPDPAQAQGEKNRRSIKETLRAAVEEHKREPSAARQEAAARWAKPNSIHVRHAVYAGIGMTYCPIIQAISNEFGGYVYANRHDLRNPNSRIQFMWSVGSRIATAFLRRIQPYTIVKRDEIDIAIALQDHIDQNPYVSAGRNHMHERKGREEIIAYREELFHRIKALKKRSFPPLPLTERRPRASVKCV